DIFVIFYYDIFAETKKLMQENDTTLHFLTTWRHVLDVSRELGRFDAQTLTKVQQFLDDPISWSVNSE
ncbi:MAG: orotate phosphoribosyltransferase, partial [Pseudomonadota bacterium]